MADKRVALISMPWMSTSFPSIQLAVLARALEDSGIPCDRFEHFLRFSHEIGHSAYSAISGGDSAAGEAVFSQLYWGSPLSAADIGAERLFNFSQVDTMWKAIGFVAERFIDEVAAETDWSQYDIVGFTLTIAQNSASMVLARQIKLKNPDIKIVIGGTSCAGPMGKALLDICPHFDYAVTIEGEEVLPTIVNRMRSGGIVSDLGGVVERGSTHNGQGHKPPRLLRPRLDGLSFDPYFLTLKLLEMEERIAVWLPIETSRGCWFGEKNQCRFCGLHEVMKYRTSDSNALVAELDRLEAKYGVKRFFAVDLIMPQEFYESTLNHLAESDRGWSFFYEIKANVTRSQITLLKRAGIEWIQPGLESLSSNSLKLMKKGCEPYHNIQLLKWCHTDSIRVSWNVLYGLPGETDIDVQETISRTHLLQHLQPPSGAGRFQLHRFSPYFENPSIFGITNIRPREIMRRVYPVADDLLANVCYQFDYDGEALYVTEECEGALQDAIARWRSAYEAGAFLRLEGEPGGGGTLWDGRDPDNVHEYRLSASEVALLKRLDSALPERATIISDSDSNHELQVGLERLIQIGAVMRDCGKLLSLVPLADDFRVPRDLIGQEIAAHPSLVG
ncbi:RiPP maturation radical SAM C-methyltransferase [Roseibium sp. RP-7]